MAVATTMQGPARGRRTVHGVLHFGGVPYAAAERFGIPNPPCRRTAEFDATRPGPCPPQVIGGLDLVPGMVPERTDEECLTVEIWTPATGGNRPVVVWVPGGSFLIGGASLPTYDGARLAAEQDLVVVGVNYRLGALGFLAADGVPTNLGLRDLRAAIAWVRANAAAFGGDPERIVLMGESAGAGAIAHLVVDITLPIAGAIALSGSPTMTQSSARAQAVAEAMLDRSGGLEQLRRMPIEDLLAAQAATLQAVLPWAGMLPFHPWIDGELLPEGPATAALTPVPLWLGTTADEMELFRAMVPALPPEHAAAYLSRKNELYPIGADEARSVVERCGGDLVRAIAEVDLVGPNDRLARQHAAAGHPVWRTVFGWRAPGVGACHALDLPFVFGTFDVDGWREFAGATDDAAEDLGRSLRAAIGRFADAGRPGSPATGDWLPWPTRIGLGSDILEDAS